MIEYLINPFIKDLFNIQGRSSRKAFWMFQLSLLVFMLIFGIISTLIVLINEILGYIFVSAMFIYVFIASITMSFRRVHDLNYSFWYSFIPLFNIYILILEMFARGTVGPNNYGEDPTDTPTGTTTPNPFTNNNQTPSSTPTPTPTNTL